VGSDPVLHAALGLFDPALNFRDGDVMLTRDFSDGGLAFEDIHDHGGLALRGPAFAGWFVAQFDLLITAL